jgi:predicted nucleic acid-binding protein
VSIKLLLDTNILLDILLEREPFLAQVRPILQGIDDDLVIGFATASSLTDVYYIIRRHTKDRGRANLAIQQILATMELCTVDRNVIESALALESEDFEDAVQESSAILAELDGIVTRDVSGFSGLRIPARLPRDWYEYL